MQCIYRYTRHKSSDNGYTVACYEVGDAKSLPDGVTNPVTVVGHYLPEGKNMTFEMEGEWITHRQYGKQFQMTHCEEVVTPTIEGITSYLSSGMIKGIGPEIAKRIVDQFGLDTLKVLDNDPDALLNISGIGQSTLASIRDSLVEYRDIRELATILLPHGISKRTAVMIYEKFKERAVKIVRANPYKLCDINGIGFMKADQIARVNPGYSPASMERVKAGILYALDQIEKSGHVCVSFDRLCGSVLDLLGWDVLSNQDISDAVEQLEHIDEIRVYDSMIYRKWAEHAEAKVAGEVLRLFRHRRTPDPRLEESIARMITRHDVELDETQMAAVKTALSESISIITGGPGTGKTMITRIVLDTFQALYPGKSICCCAPTGRAARQLMRFGGHPASTIHRALGLKPGDEYVAVEKLEADLIVVDEVSMLDIYLAAQVISAVKDGAILLLIGDAFQLPSVGPGAVLSELIASGILPVTMLDKVYRQGEGSLIAVNSRAIKHGETNLEFGEHFAFRPVTIADAPFVVEDIYTGFCDQYGQENVTILSPSRKNTTVGVNALNPRLQDACNPNAPGKREMKKGNVIFRVMDQVMMIKNRDDINNGDIGVITNISMDDDGVFAQVHFDDERQMSYHHEDLSELDLAYSSTVHKSQGSQSEAVILVMFKAFGSKLLNRHLLYTGITRARQRVVIVGEWRAVVDAVRRVDTQKRHTRLSARLSGTQRQKALA